MVSRIWTDACDWTPDLWSVNVGGLKSSCDESSGDEYQHGHGGPAAEEVGMLEGSLFSILAGCYESYRPTQP